MLIQFLRKENSFPNSFGHFVKRHLDNHKKV